MLLEITLGLIVVAALLHILRRRLHMLKARREERARRALAQRIDWRRPARQAAPRRSAWQFWR